jgi:hypothetical protein
VPAPRRRPARQEAARRAAVGRCPHGGLRRDQVRRRQERLRHRGAPPGGRRADAQAVRALVDAVGSDLRELAASCAQLVADTTGLIGPEAVERYYGGRIEATGSGSADAAVAGQSGQGRGAAAARARDGRGPGPCGRRARRQAARAGQGSRRARPRAPAQSGTSGLAPWQTDRAMADLRPWTPEGWPAPSRPSRRPTRRSRARGATPQFAVERAVLRVVAAVGPEGLASARAEHGRGAPTREGDRGPSTSPCKQVEPHPRHSSTSRESETALRDQPRAVLRACCTSVSPCRRTSRQSIFTKSAYGIIATWFGSARSRRSR